MQTPLAPLLRFIFIESSRHHNLRMYKRRDWLFTHGADGGGDETSSSSSDDSESEVQSSSDDEQSSEEAGSVHILKRKKQKPESSSDDHEQEEEEDEEEEDGDDDTLDMLYGRRMQDFSEDDFSDSPDSEVDNGKGEEDEDDDEEREQQLIMQIKSWTHPGHKDNPPSTRQPPLKCILCNGVLILNYKALQTHIVSKKHKRNVDIVAKDGHTNLELHQMFCFASDFDAALREEKEGGGDDDNNEDAETYQERMQRVDDALEKMKKTNKTGSDGDDGGGVGGNKKSARNAKALKRRVARQRKQKGGKEVKKRPGKRQRQALKEEAAAGHGAKT